MLLTRSCTRAPIPRLAVLPGSSRNDLIKRKAAALRVLVQVVRAGLETSFQELRVRSIPIAGAP